MVQGITSRRACTFKMSLLLACLVFGTVEAQLDHSELLGRAERLLATTYKITQDPDVKTNCDDQGITTSELAITLAQRDSEQANFQGANHPLVSVLDGSTTTVDYGSLITKAAVGPLGAAGVFFVFAFISLPFLFFWSICECCCKKTCCMKEPEPGQPPRSKVRIVCWILGAVIALATVGVVIGWVVSLGKVAGSVKDIKCGMTIFYSDIVAGSKLDTGKSFAGTKGLTSLIDSYITFIDSVPSIQADAVIVKAVGLDTLATTMTTKYASFKSSFSTSTYTYKGSKTASTTVTPDTATNIKGAIDSGSLQKEVTNLTVTATGIHGAMTKIAAYSTSSLSSTRSMLSSLKSTLGSGLETPITNMYNSVAGKGTPDYGSQVGSAMKTFMIVSIIVIVLFTAAYLVILYFTAKLNKFHKLKIISKIIMLLQLLLSIVILLFALIGSILTVVIVVACALFNGMINSQNYLSKLSTETTLNNIMNSCVYKSGDGDLLKALNATMSQIDDLNTISSGMSEYEAIAPNLTSQSAPYIGGAFATDLSSYLAFTAVGTGTPTSEHVKAGYDNFNTLGCLSDSIALTTSSCASGYTQASAAGDSATTCNNSPTCKYCIVFGSVPNTVTNYQAAPRYPGACTGTGTLTASAAGAALQLVVDSINDYKTKYALLNTNYGNDFYNSELAVFSGMKNKNSNLARIDTKLTDIVSSLNSMNGTFTDVADCRVMQKEIILLENIFCYRTGNNFITQNNLAVATGALIFVYCWFMCCGIRLATEKPNSPNAVSPDGFNKVPDNSVSPMNEPQGQANNLSVNKNPAGPMNNPKYAY